MGLFDWSIIIAYLSGMIGLSVYLGRSQSDQDDYYVGGRKLPWWAIGISTMATQTSAISFISIPAFVALREGGGLTWLQYELAVPLAMIVVMVFLIPFFRRLELVSVYAYLEARFDRRVRLFVSGVFLLSRGLATGVGVYASAIVLQVGLGIPLWATILIIGIVTIIYDTIGGMTAVVYSDVIQMVILVGGLLLCVVYAAAEVGGMAAIFETLDGDRLRTFDMTTGINDGGQVPFWAFLFGGLFLYASYYGTDQSQVQRQLSASSVDAARRALMFNGFARFPLTLLYILLGMAAGAVFVASPSLQAAVPSDQLDYLIPQFILLQLPPGIRAVLFAALLAAAMSSLDSALNSLSASTMRDFIGDRIQGEAAIFRWSKITTVIWGVVITAFAFVVGDISATVIEGINKIGSAFYGPILAAFLVGILTKRATSLGVIMGILAGVGTNIIFWLFAPGIYWMWWNLIGCAITLGVTMLVRNTPTTEVDPKLLYAGQTNATDPAWRKAYLGLVGYFVLMLIIMAAIQWAI